MSDNTEIELKLKLADESLWDKLLHCDALTTRAIPGSTRREEMKAAYYDTSDQALRKAGIAYRVRWEEDRWMATVKKGGSSGGGLHCRKEWNVPVGTQEPDIGVFTGTEVGPLLARAVGDDTLVPLFLTEVDRTIIDLVLDDGTKAEFAADRGRLIASGATEAINEAEIELKVGSAAAVLRFGAALALECPLLLEDRSKFARGLKLAGIEPEPELREELELVGGENACAAVQKILNYQLQSVLAAEERLAATGCDAEAVHESRVQLRGLHSALVFGKALIPLRQYVLAKAGIKRLGQELAALRELDVAMGVWTEAKAEEGNTAPAQSTLDAALEKKRNKCSRKFLAMLSAGSRTPTLLGLWAWVLEGEWANPQGVQPTLAGFAGARLGAWLRGLLADGGKKLEGGDAETLHGMRIEIKKLRYAFDELHPLCGGDGTKVASALKTLRLCLGEIHDAYVNVQLVGDLGCGGNKGISELEARYFNEREAQRLSMLRKDAKKAWRRFVNAAEEWLKQNDTI